MTSKTIYIGVVLVVALAAVGVYWYMGTQNQPPASNQKLVVVAKDVKFNVTNPTFNLKVGTVSITVKNMDTMPHNFIIREIPSAATGLLTPGQSQTINVNFTTAGDFNYYCSIHPGQMEGVIRVTTP